MVTVESFIYCLGSSVVANANVRHEYDMIKSNKQILGITYLTKFPYIL